jgi:hypothetical protein
MLFRLLILPAIAIIGLSLAGLPAMAEEPETKSATKIEQGQKSAVALPSVKQRERLSTRDRWRGKPYLRSSSDETLRFQALDRMLPPANAAFNGGASLTPLQ